MKAGLSKATLAAALVAAMALTFIACEEIGGGKSALADRWFLVEGRADRSNPGEMELLKDGTGIVGKEGVTWKTEDGRFYLTHISSALAYNYKISGSTLTLIKDDGDTLVYKTKKGIEKENADAEAAYAARLSKGAVSAKPLKDSRDGKSYKAVKIGEQVWMAENLNFEAEGSKCYGESGQVYDIEGKNPVTLPPADIQSNCSRYGRLYNWATAMKACPKGWHLPSNAEWDALYRFADGTSGAESPYKSEAAGKLLKAKEGWSDNEGKSGSGTDNFGFAALPGGLGISGGVFGGAGYDGYWWSASASYADIAYLRDVDYYGESAGWDNRDKTYLFSVRCLQD